MRILLAAPRTDLPLAPEEVQAVVNSGLDVYLLQGQVTEQDLLEALDDRNGRFDVLWLATHSDAQGVVLSDGHLSVSALAALVRSAALPAVVLNSCQSVHVAAMIHQESGADVICTIVDVADREAYRTGALMARHLARTQNLRQAYELAKPGTNRTYLYLSRGGQPAAGAQQAALQAQITQVEQGLGTVSAEVEHLWSEMRRLWSYLRPAPRKRVSVILFYTILVALAYAFAIKEIRDYALAYPVQGIAILLLALFLAFLIRWLPEDEDD